MTFLLHMARNAVWVAYNAPGAILFGVVLVAWVLPVAVAPSPLPLPRTLRARTRLDRLVLDRNLAQSLNIRAKKELARLRRGVVR
jgi:hypothetical protein